MMKSKKAFTLAEVLITLGIIGVVATLTLPNVMANYAKKSQVAQLQRSVNAVSSAIGNYLLDKKTDNFEDTGFSADPSEFFNDYLGGTYIGTYWGTDLGSAFKKQYKRVGDTYGEYDISTAINNGNTSGGYSLLYRDFACGKLVTGATVCLSRYANYDASKENDDQVFLSIVDVNSDAGPNIFGRDLFTMAFSKKGRTVLPETYGYEYCKNGNFYNGAEYYCFSTIVTDGWEMNY